MLIVHIESPNRGQQGDSIYRTVQPCRALGEIPGVTVVAGSLLSPDIHRLLPVADVLVACDVVEADLLPLFAQRRRDKRLTIYEINDDFLSPQPWNPTAYLATNLISRSLSSQLASQADAVQFTVPELERRFGHLNPERAVFSNQLWEAPAAGLKPDRLRIGWGGSLGHLEDLISIRPTLLKVLSRHPEVTLAIMAADSFRDLFQDAPRDQIEFKLAGSIESYYRFLSSLHIGLCPLLPTDFNRCRSDIKFLEYAAHGALPLCSDLEPYRDTVRPGVTGRLWRTAEELERLLENAIADEPGRLSIAKAARAHVCTERLERPRAGDRLAYYQKLQASVSQPNEVVPRPVAEWPIEPTWRPWGGSRCYHLEFRELETWLYSGLMAARGGALSEARRSFKKAAALAPEFYLAQLYLGSVESTPGGAVAALQRAADLNPLSPSVHYLLGEKRLARGETAAAREAFARCSAVAPTFGAGQARLGEMAEGRGDWASAALDYQQALVANPYYASPTLRLATHALNDRQTSDAERILLAAVHRDDRLWTTRFLLGRTRVEQGRFAEARADLAFAVERSPEPVPVLAQLAKAEIGLGHMDAARAILAEIKRLTNSS